VLPSVITRRGPGVPAVESASETELTGEDVLRAAPPAGRLAGSAQPLSVPVPAGKSGAYVSVAIQGQGRGSLAQTVTLRVLDPGHESASARVDISC
jgi:hypothetical protein